MTANITDNTTSPLQCGFGCLIGNIRCGWLLVTRAKPTS